MLITGKLKLKNGHNFFDIKSTFLRKPEGV